MRLLTIGLALALAACGGSETARETRTGGAVSFKTIAPDTLAMVYSPTAPRAEVEKAAREQCAGKQWCKVLGWDDASTAGTAMPLTDREATAQRFDYTVNRASGMDEAKWL